MVSLTNFIQRFVLFLCIPSLFLSCFLSWYRINEPLFISIGYNYFPNHSFQTEVESLSLLGKLSYFIVDILALFFLALALWFFWQLLASYKRGIYFSVEVISQLKKINFCLLGWSIYNLLFSTIASLIISCFKPAGQRFITVTMSTDDVVRFFVVLIMCMLLQLVQEACKIKNEQDLVV